MCLSNPVLPAWVNHKACSNSSYLQLQPVYFNTSPCQSDKQNEQSLQESAQQACIAAAQQASITAACQASIAAAFTYAQVTWQS